MSQKNNEITMSSGEIQKKFGITRQTLDKYVEQGYITPIQEKSNANKQYRLNDVFTAILLKALGFIGRETNTTVKSMIAEIENDDFKAETLVENIHEKLVKKRNSIDMWIILCELFTNNANKISSADGSSKQDIDSLQRNFIESAENFKKDFSDISENELFVMRNMSYEDMLEIKKAYTTLSNEEYENYMEEKVKEIIGLG